MAREARNQGHQETRDQAGFMFAAGIGCSLGFSSGYVKAVCGYVGVLAAFDELHYTGEGD